MKTIYLSRTKSGKLSLTLAAAALLAGTAAPGVLAETYTAAPAASTAASSSKKRRSAASRPR